MAAPPVTPIAGLVSQVTTGGTAVVAAGPVANGGFIQNPASAADQGLATAEDLIVNPVDVAANPNTAGIANGTNFRIPPGGTWQLIPGQTTNTSVNAVSSGHHFSVVVY